MRHAATLLALVAVVGFLPLIAVAQAGDAPPTAPVAAPPVAPPTLGPGKGQITLTWDEFVKITGYDPSKKGAQVLTVPWAEVENLLGVELKGKVGMDKSTVDLPWTDFKALMEWSIKKRPDMEPPPPADYVVLSSEYSGTIGADAANLTLKVKVNVLRKTGWKRIPLLPSTVAITKSTLPAGAYLNATQGNVYELLTDKTGEMEVIVSFDVQTTKNAGITTVTFDRPLPASSMLDLKVADEQADVKIANAQSLTTKVADKQTNVLAAVPSGGALTVTWQRALPKAAAVPTKIYAETKTLVGVAEGVQVCTESIDLNILHTAIRELKLTAPTGVSVLDVSGPNVQDWRADKEGAITVTLRGEAIGGQNLRVSYESPFAVGAVADNKDTDTKVQVPVIRVAGVEREKGFVGVIALANVEIKAGDITGATTVDVKELPADITGMTKQPVLLGFRYVADKFTLPLTIKRHSEVDVLITIVDAAVYTSMQLNDGRRMTRALYTVRNNRNQFLRLSLPAGAEVWSVAVSGNTVTPAQDEQKKLLIPLVRSSAGSQELSSFPVELVYVETPKLAPPAAGTMRVSFPGLDSPVMHVMVNYYAPAEGKYGQAGGLFSAPKSGFGGPLGLVKDFASMVTDRDVVAKVNAPQQAQAMQQQFEGKMQQQAKEAGVTPIRVRLPLEGQTFKLEKILALQGDEIFFTVEYSDWKAAK